MGRDHSAIRLGIKPPEPKKKKTEEQPKAEKPSTAGKTSGAGPVKNTTTQEVASTDKKSVSKAPAKPN
jgi:hypothetical protein